MNAFHWRTGAPSIFLESVRRRKGGPTPVVVDDEEIRRLRAAGNRYDEIARKLGVGHDTVYKRLCAMGLVAKRRPSKK